ncbi:uncharacterized protein UTRI_06259_B [Ustilago trichophora]|uniref:Chitinase domain-containing protein 1 n=1 Tax=Ustilago trichophora TaxID=86804 RepID=A0A5C3EH84_9BASI|nr:uncharacterized protein UTRI_06259_B [Ustilago trichophora]
MLVTALLADAASATPTILDTSEYIRLHNDVISSDDTSKKSNQTILAYITPWNPKGLSMADDYAAKIDMISPVWYTILVSSSSSSGEDQETSYRLSGGPPGKVEEQWLKRKLQQDSRVKIVPRFYLDNWAQKDYANLLSNPNNWQSLAKVITDEVVKRQYDGVVFESAATHLLFEPIQALSSSLLKISSSSRARKSLTVVLPPLRTKYSLGDQKVDRVQESQNRMIVQSIPQLAQVVDYFSIMTYDMSSAGGRISGISGKEFPKDSPLRGAKKGSLRQPGPNTSAKWIEENLGLIEEASRKAAQAKLVKTKKEFEKERESQEMEGDGEMEKLKDPSNPFLYDDFSAIDENLNEDEVADVDAEKKEEKEEQVEVDELALIQGKLLMGMPMYGYRYPIFWIDKSTGQGVPIPSPSDPFEARELLSRSRPSSQTAILPFLRGPGEPLTMTFIISILTDNDGIIVDPKQHHGEGWFDYTETITKETLKDHQTHGVKIGDQIYWRLYLPLPSTTKSRLTAIKPKQELKVGVSLWELGQASRMLLNDL